MSKNSSVTGFEGKCKDTVVLATRVFESRERGPEAREESLLLRVLGGYEQWPEWDPKKEFFDSDSFYFVSRTGTYRLHLLAIEVLSLQLYCAQIPGESPRDMAATTRLLRKHLERKNEIDLFVEAEHLTRIFRNPDADSVSL